MDIPEPTLLHFGALETGDVLFVVTLFALFYLQGNMQRCKLVIDQITEAKDTMMKVLDHKDRVLKLLNKNGAVKKVSKLKRKEKS